MRKACFALGGMGLVALAAVLGERAAGDPPAQEAGVVVVRITSNGTLAVTDALGAFRWLDGSLASPDPATQRGPLEPLREVLVASAQDPARRAAVGSPRFALEVRAAAGAAWPWVEQVLQVGADPRVKIRRIRFAPPDDTGERIARTVPKDGVPVIAVNLSRMDGEGLGMSRTRVKIGDEEWILTTGRVGEDSAVSEARSAARGRVFDAMRAKIADLHAANAELSGEIAVSTRAGEAVPYEDVWGVMHAFAEAALVGWRHEGAPASGKERGDVNELAGGAGGAFAWRSEQRRLRASATRDFKKADDAMEHALRWLTAHQSSDGGWAAAGWNTWCGGKRVAGELEGLGRKAHDVGVTGLAVLAFLGAGYTSRGDPPFADVVDNALRYLNGVQDAEGCFGSRESGQYVYNHAIAALAMVEAYGMTGSPKWRASAQKALDFVGLTRNPYFAWRYGVKPGDNDTSVTSWMATVIQSAELVNRADAKAGRPASLVFDGDTGEGITSWLDKVTDPDYGRLGYQIRGRGPWRSEEIQDRFPPERSESMTAVGVFLRMLLGQAKRRQGEIKKGAVLCSGLLPTWNPHDGSIDMYYWFYGTLAMRQIGGAEWNRWDEALRGAVVQTQREDGDYCAYRGSWDPIDPWGRDGGRVYSTAILALCLEGSYRYERVLAR